MCIICKIELSNLTIYKGLMVVKGCIKFQCNSIQNMPNSPDWDEITCVIVGKGCIKFQCNSIHKVPNPPDCHVITCVMVGKGCIKFRCNSIQNVPNSPDCEVITCVMVGKGCIKFQCTTCPTPLSTMWWLPVWILAVYLAWIPRLCNIWQFENIGQFPPPSVTV